MKIKTLQIQNFEGFDGTYEYVFHNTINALCLKNGAGKTSFLNALRYGITGIKPSGNMINIDANSAAVGLTFHDGTGIIRQEFADSKSARYYLNRRPVTKKDLDEYLQSRAGVMQGTMKIATSADVLAGLKPQEFGDLLLSYIPESLTKDKLIKMIDNLTAEEEAEIVKYFPDDTFGTEKIDDFYRHIMDLRKALNKKMSECESYLNHFAGMTVSSKTKEELEAELTELNKKQGGVNLYREQKRNYDQLVKRKKDRDDDIARLKKEIEELGEIKIDEDGYKKTVEFIENAQNQLRDIEKNISSFENLIKTLEKALDDINKPICPLSEKLKCTTDKSVIRDEIEQSLKSGRDSVAENTKKRDEIQSDLNKARAYIKEANDKKILAEKKKNKEEQLKRRLEEEIVVPEEPQKSDEKDLSGEIKAVVDALSLLKSAEDIKRVKTFVDSNRAVLAAYNNLVKMFAPKGMIKSKIAEYYMNAFEDQCNMKAKELLPGMSLKFVSNAGISVLTDINGDGNYVSFDSLSGGERSYVLFILLDMINCLTGLRMMFLDELSVLAMDAFETLVKIVKEHEEDYDLIILAAAEHDDNIATLNNYKIHMIDF